LDGGNGAFEPNVLETWELYGCYLQNVDYGDMNYGTSDPATIALTILFDNANQIPDGSAGAGIGALVGRTVGDIVTG
jgi:hypothetical protein